MPHDGDGDDDDRFRAPSDNVVDFPNADEVIEKLADLPEIEYDQHRNAEAKRLGVRREILDRAVKAKRGDGEEAPFVLPEPEPWPVPVDGDDLLDQLGAKYREYLVLPDDGEVILSLWTIHTHTYDTGVISPRLAIQSPERECGKSTVLTILGRMVPRPLPTSNITTPALFRTIQAARPTVLVDEIDTFVKGDDELRGVLNSGHYKPQAYVIRTVGDDYQPQFFSTWAPVAFGGIGTLPDTLQARSIILEMRRKRPDEQIKRLRIDQAEDLDDLGRMVARWAVDHAVDLAGADPDVPEVLGNRPADNWRPLLAIADLAGGDWPERVRQIAVMASGASEELSVKAQLLADLRNLFREKGPMFSDDICHTLAEMEERRWPEWRNGKPITQRQLASLLKAFKIKPKQIWIGHTQKRGYERAWFEDAFARYLPSDPSQASQVNESGALEGNQSVTTESAGKSVVTDETTDKPLKNKPCDACDTSEGGASGDNYEAEEREAIQNEPEVDLLDIPEFLRRNDH